MKNKDINYSYGHCYTGAATTGAAELSKRLGRMIQRVLGADLNYA